jgi:hypothetical protein
MLLPVDIKENAPPELVQINPALRVVIDEYAFSQSGALAVALSRTYGLSIIVVMYMRCSLHFFCEVDGGFIDAYGIRTPASVINLYEKEFPRTQRGGAANSTFSGNHPDDLSFKRMTEIDMKRFEYDFLPSLSESEITQANQYVKMIEEIVGRENIVRPKRRSAA